MRGSGLWVLVLLGACAGPAARNEQPRAAPGASFVREGDRLRRQGLDSEATDAYRRALESDPDNVRAHVGLQEIALRRGEDLQVRRIYRKGPSPFLAARLEGSAERQREGYEQAVEPYRSLGLGMAAAAEDGVSSSARRHLARARAIDPGLSWSRLALARQYLGRGELGLAEAEYRAAAWCDPEGASAWLGLSVVADRRGDFAGAYLCAMEAYRRAPFEQSLAARLRGIAARSGSKEYLLPAAELLEEHGDASAGVAFLYAGDLLGRAGDSASAARVLGRAEAQGATKEEIDTVQLGSLTPPFRRFVRRFRRGVEARYRHYAATGESESFDDFHAWARRVYEATTGLTLAPAGKPLEFAFVGTMVDPTEEGDEPLVAACADAGLLLVLGQRSGGPPEAMLSELVRREPMSKIRVGGATVEREVAYLGHRYLSGFGEWAGGGDLAGLALARIILVDLDEIARWEGEIRRRLARLEPRRAALLAEPALADRPTTEVDDPAGVADRLYLTGQLDLVEEVRVHEDGHLVDAERHLPVSKHVLRNLRLAIQGGFKASEILALLERNAQLAAIAEGPSPRTALATCCGVLDRQGVHARGYRAIVEGMVELIAEDPAGYPEIDTTRVIVQQLHRLPEEKIRRLARALRRTS